MSANTTATPPREPSGLQPVPARATAPTPVADIPPPQEAPASDAPVPYVPTGAKVVGSETGPAITAVMISTTLQELWDLFVQHLGYWKIPSSTFTLLGFAILLYARRDNTGNGRRLPGARRSGGGIGRALAEAIRRPGVGAALAERIRHGRRARDPERTKALMEGTARGARADVAKQAIFVVQAFPEGGDVEQLYRALSDLRLPAERRKRFDWLSAIPSPGKPDRPLALETPIVARTMRGDPA